MTIIRWIHLCSMAMLVGGMTFVFFALRPALSRDREEPAIKTASSFLRARFRWIAVVLTAAIVASGIVGIIVAPPKKWYILLLIFKVLLAGAIVFFYFRNAFAKMPAAAAPEPGAAPPADAADVGLPEKEGEWKTAWLLSPGSPQLRMELMLIAGALVVILLGIILAHPHAG